MSCGERLFRLMVELDLEGVCCCCCDLEGLGELLYATCLSGVGEVPYRAGPTGGSGGSGLLTSALDITETELPFLCIVGELVFASFLVLMAAGTRAA